MDEQIAPIFKFICHPPNSACPLPGRDRENTIAISRIGVHKANV